MGFSPYFIIICISYLYFVSCSQRVRIKVMSIKDCELPKEKYDPEGVLTDKLEIIPKTANLRYISGYVTVPKKSIPMSFNMRSYKRNTPSNYEFDVRNLTCKNTLITMALKKMKIKHDDDCSFLPGNNSFKIDVDEFRRTGFSILPPGE